MPRYELTYPKEAYNTVKRENERADYALRTIHGIVNAAPLVHVAFQPADVPFPAVLPMIGQMGSFARPSAEDGDVQDLYLHGYVSSRLVNLARASTAEAEAEAASTDAPSSSPLGLPVTVSAALVDGLVLALTPNAHSFNYRSAVLFGHAILVSDTAERLYAMERITDKIVPGRWAQTRVPPNAAEMQSTAILRVRIAGGSAKVRVGSTHDDRCDLDNEAVLDAVWAGVLPLAPVLGAPVPAPYNRVAPVPAYLEQFRADFNAAAHDHSVAAIAEPTKTAETAEDA